MVQYSFNVLNWTIAEIKRMDAKMRKLLTCYWMHHPKADVDCLYVPRFKGGRGLVQLELSYKTTTIGLQRYLETTEDWMMVCVKEHESSKRLYSVMKEANKFKMEFQMGVEMQLQHNTPAETAKYLKKQQRRMQPTRYRSDGKINRFMANTLPVPNKLT